MHDLIKLTSTDINNRVYKEWKVRVKEENVRVAEQVKELVYVRDQMDEWLLERGKSMILLIIFVMNNIYV